MLLLTEQGAPIKWEPGRRRCCLTTIWQDHLSKVGQKAHNETLQAKGGHTAVHGLSLAVVVWWLSSPVQGRPNHSTTLSKGLPMHGKYAHAHTHMQECGRSTVNACMGCMGEGWFMLHCRQINAAQTVGVVQGRSTHKHSII